MSQWRVAIGQKQYGPYSLEKLKQIYEEGRVPPDAQIWHPEEETWMGAADVPELNSVSDDIVIVDDAVPQSGSQIHSSSRSAPATGDSISDFLSFRRMITPIMIQIIFWIGAVLSSLTGILFMIMSISQENVGGIFMGFFMMLLGPIIVRIYCELLIVIFRMNETLTDISKQLKSSS